MRQAEREGGRRPGLTTDERVRFKPLERENVELRRANEILRLASAYFAKAELDRPITTIDYRPHDLILAHRDFFEPLLVLFWRRRELEDQEVARRFEVGPPFRDAREMFARWWFQTNAVTFENRPEHAPAYATHESSRERRPWSERSYEGRGSPANPRAARRSWPRWSSTRYSITWSARPSTDGGIVRPSVLAVWRLTTVSNVVGCWTGRSPGFAPLSILSAYTAPCRN